MRAVSRPGAAWTVLNSLALRIGMAFAVALFLLLGVIAAALIWPDDHPTLFRLVAPEEAAAMARALESGSPEQQALMVRALNHGRLAVSLLDGFPPQAGPAPYLNRLYTRYARELGDRPFRVERSDGLDIRKADASTSEAIRAAKEAAAEGTYGSAHRVPGSVSAVSRLGGVRLMVGLKTGQVLVLDSAPVLLQRLSARLAIVGAATALILLLVMLYCVRQIALPARRVAAAARRLATDTGIPDLPTRGSSEIAVLSASFNEMKHTIRGLMQERTRVLAAIAHDLRTYLTRLRLRADFIDDEDQRQRAVRDLDEMAWLLDDTLTFASETAGPAAAETVVIDARAELLRFVALRQEIGDPVHLVVDANSATPGGADTPMPADTFTHASADMSAAANTSMPAIADTPASTDLPTPTPAPIRCSPLALRRMLSNLTDNAVRYGERAYLSIEHDDGRVMLTVEDDGPGVPPALLARLAQPFERGEPSRGRQTGGTGLGLAIVKALAQSQGGNLHIQNRPQGGLRVTVALPLAPRC